VGRAHGGGAEARGSIDLRRLSAADRWFVGGAVVLVMAIQAALVWLPAIASVGLSFTSWDGVGGLEAIRPVGLANYAALVGDPRFGSAILNNLLWLIAYLGVATPLGLLLAVAIDRPLRGARLYQAALYVPALLSLALVGFIWQLQYSPDQGLLNGLLGRSGATAAGPAPIDWIGDRSINRVAILVPAIWRHVGTVVVLYLAGLRTIDPAVREAAMLDGASELVTVRSVLLPALRPVTTVVLAIGMIDALRAFDLAYVLNAGINGLELLATLITATVAGAATRVGLGSAMATVLIALSLPAILGFLALRARGDDA
jgi:multiple sugar transport system permease protein